MTIIKFNEILNENKLIDKIDKLSIRPLTGDIGNDIYVNKLIKFDDSILKRFPFKIWKSFKFDKLINIDIDKLIVTQNTVKRLQILNLIKKFDKSKLKIKVLKENNKYYVVDGTHSLITAIIMDIKKVKVNIKEV